MKKVMIICAFLVGCSPSDDTKLSDMKSPVTIVAVRCEGGNVSPVVTVKDSTGEIFTLWGGGAAYALQSRNIGDTIK